MKKIVVLVLLVALGVTSMGKEEKGKLKERAKKSIAKHKRHHYGRGKYETRNINNFDEVLPLTNPKAVPRVVYGTEKVKLANLGTKKKKEKFLAIMVPTALVVREEIEIDRKKVKLIYEKKIKYDKKFIENLCKIYKVKSNDPKELYKKMKPVPVSVLLAQASIETGWGTSRFFHKANNIFGVWSMDPNEARIPAGQARKTRQVYLKKYSTLKGSVEGYMRLMGRHPAYKGFRKELQHTEKSSKLIPHLNKYSEIGMEYVKRLRAQIKYNKLDQYDHYKLEK